MLNKLIPFPYEIKITHLISVTTVFTISIKSVAVEAFFLFYFFISVIMALGRMV